MARMIDLTPQPDRDCWRDGVAPADVNRLIQARIDGKISRRELVRRAAALGIAAPVVGVMLHATSDFAFGAPNPGKNRHFAPTGQGQTIPADGPTAPAGERQEGGTIVAGTTEEPDTLHPWLTQLVTTFDILQGVMQGLLQYDSTQTLIPSLAEGFEISEDGLSYTFALRQGVTWHNGDPFTAQDVIESWKMIMNDEFGAWSQLGWEKITDVTAPDETSVTFVTSEPFAPFISFVAAETALCPASEMAAGPAAFKEAFTRNLIGTGPMTFVEWQTGEQIVVERNDAYWGTAPALERVILRILPDDNTLLVQLRTGEIQMASGGSGSLGALRVDEALEIDDLVILEHPTLGWSHLDLKNIKFLRETEVRQALDFATPTQDIIDRLLKGRVVRSVADQAPGTPFRNPDIEGRPYDLEQAKALLDGVGLVVGDDDVRARDGEPFEMQIWGIAGDTTQQQIIQVIAQSWNSIGIKTETFFEDVSTIWGPEGYQFDPETMTACLYSWFNSNDPDDMFYWHSSQIPETPDGTGGNITAYFYEYNFQAEIDDLTERAAAETNLEARIALYHQIQEVLHREVPVIFISWGKAFPALAPNIGGHWPSAYNRLLWNVQDWYLTA